MKCDRCGEEIKEGEKWKKWEFGKIHVKCHESKVTEKTILENRLKELESS